jgi:hypothetical protein
MLQFVKPFAAVFTFIIGTFASYVLMPLPASRPVVCNDSACLVETPVCRIGDHPELYNGKLVRTRMDIRLIQTAYSTELVTEYGGGGPMRITCLKGYKSCYELLDDIIQAQPDDIKIYADGWFYNSVTYYNPDGTSRRIPMFEIKETRSVRVSGEKFPLKGSYGNDLKYVDKINGAADGRGTGHGHGIGNGRGTGQGTGSGSGSGTGTGYAAANTTSGTGPGGGGSGGANRQ